MSDIGDLAPDPQALSHVGIINAAARLAGTARPIPTDERKDP